MNFPNTTSNEALFKDTVLRYFDNVKDLRVLDNQKYPFSHLLFMIVCSIICGADDVEAIVNYIESKFDWFSANLNLVAPPSYKAIWWVLVLINPQEFQKAFTSFVTDLCQQLSCVKQEHEKQEVIAIDGKTCRGTKRDNVKALHLVSAWSSSCQLILGRVKTEEKSNEITAIPELLK